MLVATDNNHVKYAGCFFLATGIYPNVPQGVAWNGNNIGGSLKRGVGIASKSARKPIPCLSQTGRIIREVCVAI